MIDMTVDVYRRFSEDAGSFLAATISYYALFSIFPLLLLAISAAGYVLAYRGGSEDILRYVDNVLPQFSGFVKTNVESIAQNRGPVGLIGLLALFWSGTAVFEAIQFALDKVFKVPVPRHFILSKLLSFTGVLTIVLLLMSTIWLSTVYEVFQDNWQQAFKTTPPLAALRAAAKAGGLATNFIALLIIYRVVPNLRLSWKDVWPGAAFAVIAWEIAKRIFIIYTARAAKFAAVYGSVGVIVGLLFWLYITGIILVLGGEINASRLGVGSEKD